MKIKFKQLLAFLIVSGVGWLIDFGLYSLLVYGLEIRLTLANMVSAIPAISYVFVISTKNIFINKSNNIPLKYKYIIYFIYQFVLIAFVSYLAGIINRAILDSSLGQLSLIVSCSALLSKIIITPITMALNFIVMKVLVEKI